MNPKFRIYRINNAWLLKFNSGNITIAAEPVVFDSDTIPLSNMSINSSYQKYFIEDVVYYTGICHDSRFVYFPIYSIFFSLGCSMDDIANITKKLGINSICLENGKIIGKEALLYDIFIKE